jgi:hypothetical protein
MLRRFFIPAASSLRMPPSRPRASAHNHGDGGYVMPAEASPRSWLARVRFRRVIRTLCYLVFVPVLICYVLLILAFAHAFAHLEERHIKSCFAEGFVNAHWPDWIGCAIAAHESLAAGLISSAVAVLGAVIAVDAVWQQIKNNRQKIQDGEVRRDKLARQRLELERANIQRVVGYYSRLLQPFNEAQGTDDNAYIKGLNRLARSGNLTQFYGTLPSELRPIVRDAYERLHQLNVAVNNFQKKVGEPDLTDPSEINESVRTMVEKLRDRCSQAQKELAARETPAES